MHPNPIQRLSAEFDAAARRAVAPYAAQAAALAAQLEADRLTVAQYELARRCRCADPAPVISDHVVEVAPCRN